MDAFRSLLFPARESDQTPSCMRTAASIVWSGITSRFTALRGRPATQIIGDRSARHAPYQSQPSASRAVRVTT